jgi:hypothetical protein
MVSADVGVGVDAKTQARAQFVPRLASDRRRLCSPSHDLTMARLTLYQHWEGYGRKIDSIWHLDQIS